MGPRRLSVNRRQENDDEIDVGQKRRRHIEHPASHDADEPIHTSRRHSSQIHSQSQSVGESSNRSSLEEVDVRVEHGSERHADTLSKEDTKSVKAFIRAALMGARSGKLLKREFFIDTVPELKGKKFRELLPFVNDYLMNVFGQELYECASLEEQQSKPSQKGTEIPMQSSSAAATALTSTALSQSTTSIPDNKSNCFLLRSLLVAEPSFSEELVEREAICQFPEESTEVGLLSMVLSIILLNHRVIEEKALFAHLENLDPRHSKSVFPDFERSLNQFCHQSYLRKRKTPQSVEYRWGTRAFAETNEMRMCAFFSEIMKTPLTESMLQQVQRSSGDQ